MIRLRRYRVFLIVTVFIVLGIYYLSDSTSWSSTIPLGPPSHRYFGDSTAAKPPEQLHGKLDGDDELFKEDPPPAGAEDPEHVHAIDLPPVKTETLHEAVKAPSVATPTDASKDRKPVVPQGSDPKAKTGDPPVESDSDFAEFVPTSTPAVDYDEDSYAAATKAHWKSPTQHHPVPTKSVIPLPRGQPKKIKRIQYDFPALSPAANEDRESKLADIKKVMNKTWEGYRKYAWGHDELRPVSGGYKDPFAGWGATLVDSLDTLWIMGMKTEFEEAVNATSHIDFTTTDRNDLPLFEVTIRYLGGLIGAFDVSGRKYKVLLEKAVQLAEVLIGAFDTPNRMPMTTYYWQPSMVSGDHQAGAYTVLAEIGTLSLEFTRLAQLTKQPKYYDAVARITNALYEWQNSTNLPGLYPLHVDAAGCASKGPTKSHSQLNGPPARAGANVLDDVVDFAGARKPASGASGDSEVDGMPADISNAGEIHGDNVDKLNPQVAPVTGPTRETPANTDSEGAFPKTKRQTASKDDNVCGKAQLASGDYGNDMFTFGGMADSVYEYFPKTYLLLGGLEDKYKNMHEYAMDTMKQYLLYRPMARGSQDIRFTGSFSTSGEKDRRGNIQGRLDPSTGHLTCFIGALVGLGAKIFDRPEMDIATRLADGCVWAYDEQPSGVMPEEIEPVPCKDMYRCEWDEKQWWLALDPMASERPNATDKTRSDKDSSPGSPARPIEPDVKDPEKVDLRRPAATPTTTSSAYDSDETPSPDDDDDHALNKRQLRDAGGVPILAPSKSTNDVWPPIAADNVMAPSDSPSPISMSSTKESDREGLSSSDVSGTVGEEAEEEEEEPPEAYGNSESIRDRPMTHEEFVKWKIKNEELTPGLKRIGGRNYILRPEAIESVFYMFRITGENRWREKGWRMFNAINAATSTNHGNSAIVDVTKASPSKLDSAESFWTAETLKYFYLLFSDPEVISLDDYVLNTEAHPFLRPDAKVNTEDQDSGPR